MPCGFATRHELTTYITCIWLGISVLLAFNTFLAAPNYIEHYYKLTAHNWNATPDRPSFWDHILAISTFILLTPSFCTQLLNLTPPLQRLPQHHRLVANSCVLTIVMALFPIMTRFHLSQNSTMIFLLINAIVGAMATGFYESTLVGFVATLPHIYIGAVFIGIGLSGTIVAIIGIITQAALPETLRGETITGAVYYGVAAFLNFIGLVLLHMLQYNPFAHRFMTEYRVRRSTFAHNSIASSSGGGAAGNPLLVDVTGDEGVVSDEFVKMSIAERRASLASAGGARQRNRHASSTEDRNGDDNRSRPRTQQRSAATTSSTGAGDGGGTPTAAGYANSTRFSSSESETSSVGSDNSSVITPYAGSGGGGGGRGHNEQELQQDAASQLEPANIFEVFVCCAPLVIAETVTFAVTMLVFPGVLTAHPTDWKWFTLLVVFLYNFGNAMGCMSTHIQALWIPRRLVLPASVARMIILVPLCFFGVDPPLIPGVAFPMVISVVVGLTDGYLCTLAPVYAPSSEGLTTEKQRNLAGNLCDFALLLGCTVGSCYGVFVNTRLD